MTPSFSLTAAVLGTPDPQGLARFYQRMLGWPIRDDTPQWATLRPADGSTGLSFQLETDHVPPVWPQGPGDQQMQQHDRIGTARHRDDSPCRRQAQRDEMRAELVPQRHRPSRTSRTLRDRSAGTNGFCRNGAPGWSNPRRTISSSV